MSRTTRRAAAVWLGVAVCCGLAAAGAPSAATFRFAPPEGTKQAEVIQTTQTVLAGKPTVRATEMRATLEFRRTGGRQTVSVTVTGGGIGSGKGKQPDPAITALKGLPLTYTIDAQGRMQSVTGLDKVPARLKSGFSAAEVKRLAPLLTAPAILRTQRIEWGNHVADFVERPAKEGAVWVTRSQFPLPDGRMVGYYVAHRISGGACVQGRNLLRVLTMFSTQPNELRSFLGRGAEQALKGLKPLSGQDKVTGNGERLVDPATLLWYDGRSTRRLQTSVQASDGGKIAVTVTMARTYQITQAAAK